jgi:hypothetical protein
VGKLILSLPGFACVKVFGAFDYFVRNIPAYRGYAMNIVSGSKNPDVNINCRVFGYDAETVRVIQQCSCSK